MLKDITIGQYYPTNSIIHKLDPRVKIIFTFVFMVSLFIVNTFSAYIFVFGMLAAVIVLSKVPFSYILRGVKAIIYLLLFTFVLNVLFTNGGKIYFEYGIIKITQDGLNLGFFMLIRLLLLIIGASMLTLVTTPIQLTDALENMLSPFKKMGLPSHELAMMMTIALRFIPTLLDETDKIMKAQMARGADFESKNIINRAKSMIPLLVPLFISAFRRADELAMAMESRCYHGGEGRTRLKQIKYVQRDYIALAILFFYLIISVLIRNYKIL